MAKQNFEELIREGMAVVSADGQKLGKVTQRFDRGFEIEKGVFFRTEYRAAYADVKDVRGNEVFLALTRAELEHRAAQPMAAQPAVTSPGQETRIPVVEEEIVVHKEQREAGEVRVHKETVVEEQTVKVPVQHEVVRVERVPASGEAPRAGAFEEQTVSVPVRTEDVSIETRPVVKEEIVISKETKEAQKEATAAVRREQVDVEGKGELKEREIPEEEQRLKKAG